ncbi:hypothetical protein MOP88_06635 [Sphingomonas sp. WKB10]|nr:hypothetical protein [Sphingomonas sp. WKB10]
MIVASVTLPSATIASPASSTIGWRIHILLGFMVILASGEKVKVRDL